MQTLLLVDDEPNIVEGLASQFEGRYGGDVIVLKSFSGLHALSILQNNKVDVVLSDIRMPDMDGLTLQRETEALWPRSVPDRWMLSSGLIRSSRSSKKPMPLTLWSTPAAWKKATHSITARWSRAASTRLRPSLTAIQKRFSA